MKSYVIIFLMFLLAVFVSADEVMTGSLLYIQSTQPSRVVLDGKDLGHTPMLLDDININTRRLQLFGDTLYSEFTLSYNKNIQQITRIFPEGTPYYGFLKLSGLPEGATLIIDEDEITGYAETPVQLSTGIHTFRVEKEGYHPQEMEIEIQINDTSSLMIEMEEICQVLFPQFLPRDTRLLFSKDEETVELIYQGQESIRLSKGKWDLTVSNPLFVPVSLSLDLEKPETMLELELEYYQPYISLMNLDSDCRIYLNGEEIEMEDTGEGKIPAQGGENLLVIQKSGYLDVTEEVSLEGDQILEINLEFAKDPQQAASSNKTTGWIMISTGVAFIASGMILNYDEILLPLTEDYEQYETLKYVSLGITGTGLLSLLTGTGFLGLGIINSQK